MGESAPAATAAMPGALPSEEKQSTPGQADDLPPGVLVGSLTFVWAFRLLRLTLQQSACDSGGLPVVRSAPRREPDVPRKVGTRRVLNRDMLRHTAPVTGRTI